MNSDIKIDLLRDWSELMTSELQRLGYRTDDVVGDDQLGIRYANVRHRRIPAAKRAAVHPNPDIIVPPELQAGFDALVAASDQGDDLTPFQSTLLLEADYSDPLLNDWGIHHLHLGAGIHPTHPGFKSRTGPLLFTAVTSGSLYLIAVLPHKAWAQQALLEVMHKNWPELLLHCKVPEARALSTVPSDSDVAALRKANINTAVQMADGTIYMAPGMGSTTDGTSVRVVRVQMRIRRLLRDVEKRVKQDLPKFVHRIRKQGLEPGSPPEFKLVVQDSKITVVEINSVVQFTMTDFPGGPYA